MIRIAVWKTTVCTVVTKQSLFLVGKLVKVKISRYRPEQVLGDPEG
jgi:hypothetical protein